MKNPEQLFQQHYIENGAGNSLLTSKPTYEIIKTHIERIRKKKKKSKQNRDSLRKRPCCTPVRFPG